MKPKNIEEAVRRKWKKDAEKERWFRKLAAVRRRKLLAMSEQQGHRCCYCSTLTWMFDTHRESSLLHYEADRLPGMTDKMMATLEHIVAAAEGGTEHSSNLIMSCYRCNSLRGHLISAMEFWEVRQDRKRFAQFLGGRRSILNKARSPKASPEQQAVAKQKKALRKDETIFCLAAWFHLLPDGRDQLAGWIGVIEAILTK